jgi:membrane-bound ClpP family serine protease
MHSFRTLISRSIRIVPQMALLAALLAPAMPAQAAAAFTPPHSSSQRPAIEVGLADGRTWRGDLGCRVRVRFIENSVAQTLEGTLSRAEPTHILLATRLMGRAMEKPIFRADLRSIETITEEVGSQPLAATSTARAAASGATAKPHPATRGSDGVRAAPLPGVFLLPLSGTVGVSFRHQEIEAIAAEADKHGPGQIVVLLIDSGGGLVIEAERISESLQAIKTRHRVVAWVKEAISAAAYTALHCDEIYFMRVGALGAMTMFAGEQAIAGDAREDWLRRCSEIAELGGRDPIPVRAMVTMSQMASYDKDPVTSKVTWHPDTTGRYVLSSETETLVLNASNALHSRFSDGTADTTAELAALLDIDEWHEVTDHGRRIAKRWQETVEACEREVPLIIARLGFEGLHGSAETALATRIKLLRELQGWWHRCDNVMRHRIQAPERGELDRMIRDLQKQIADIRRRSQER